MKIKTYKFIKVYTYEYITNTFHANLSRYKNKIKYKQ